MYPVRDGVCVCVCMCVCVCVCICVEGIYVWVFMRTCVWTYMHDVCVCVYVCVCVRVCVCVCMDICMHVSVTCMDGRADMSSASSVSCDVL